MDVLRWPLLGPFLRWRHARTSLQVVLLAGALAIVVHGFLGSDVGSANLATVVTWLHYRGLLVLVLLAAGNFFCAGCPFIRVRDWGRRLHAPSRVWPAWLKGKTAAILLFVAVLFTYELFDLWALPGATAWLVLAYFAGALVVDLTFRGATFCKHVCPVGQFNFLASTLSPLEVKVRSEVVCSGCRTADCISGRKTIAEPARVVQRGCELGLFLPGKVGNLDCTFCLDCVQACPHDNVALAARVPGVELASDARRAGIGMVSSRPDLAALAVVFVFGAWLNAFAMTAPAYQVQAALAEVVPGGETAALAALFAMGLIVVPAALLSLAGSVTKVLTGAAAPPSHHAMHFVFGLVPLGVAMWMAHYGFHFATGVLVIVPVTQSAVVDLFGVPALGTPLWSLAGMRPGDVYPLQLGALLLGTTGSVAVTYLIAEREHPEAAARAAGAWMLLAVLLAVAAVAILGLPMEMRGTGL